MNENIREALCDMGYEEAVVFDGPEFDDAIVGVTDEGQVVYDYDKMVLSLMRQDNITEEEAIEFIEYNTIRALPYAGEHAPIIMSPLSVEKITTDNKRDKLLEIVKNAGYDNVYCTSDGDPVCKYSSPVVAGELVEPFTDYLITNGVTVQDPTKEEDNA